MTTISRPTDRRPSSSGPGIAGLVAAYDRPRPGGRSRVLDAHPARQAGPERPIARRLAAEPGPHALYSGGALAAYADRAAGSVVPGGDPARPSAVGVARRRAPPAAGAAPATLLRTGCSVRGARLRFARLLASLGPASTGRSPAGRSFADWLADEPDDVRRPRRDAGAHARPCRRARPDRCRPRSSPSCSCALRRRALPRRRLAARSSTRSTSGSPTRVARRAARGDLGGGRRRARSTVIDARRRASDRRACVDRRGRRPGGRGPAARLSRWTVGRARSRRPASTCCSTDRRREPAASASDAPSYLTPHSAVARLAPTGRWAADRAALPPPGHVARRRRGRAVATRRGSPSVASGSTTASIVDEPLPPPRRPSPTRSPRLDAGGLAGPPGLDDRAAGRVPRRRLGRAGRASRPMRRPPVGVAAARRGDRRRRAVRQDRGDEPTPPTPVFDGRTPAPRSAWRTACSARWPTPRTSCRRRGSAGRRADHDGDRTAGGLAHHGVQPDRARPAARPAARPHRVRRAMAARADRRPTPGPRTTRPRCSNSATA